MFVDDEDDERSYNFQMAILETTDSRDPDVGLPLAHRARRAQLRDQAIDIAATGRQSASQSRGKRTVTSASPMRRS